MNRMNFTLVLVFVFTIASANLFGQEEGTAPPPPTRIGIFAGGLYSMHSGGFNFPESSLPPLTSYDEGNAFGPAFGIRFDVPLTRGLWISPRLFAECRRGDFTSDPFSMEIIGKDLQPQTMTLEDNLEVILRTAGLDLMIMWQPMKSGPYLLAGPHVGMKLYEEFRVTERIVSPALVTFIDGSREKEVYDDDPEFTRDMAFGFRAGAGYSIALNRDMALGAEVLYLMQVPSVREDSDWSLSGLQATLALLFTL